MDLGHADQPVRTGRQLLSHRSHVLPALIRRYEEACRGRPVVTNWGSGSPRREFLHVDDMASACLHLLEHYDGPQQVNVGVGRTSRSGTGRDRRTEVGYEGRTGGTPRNSTGHLGNCLMCPR